MTQYYFGTAEESKGNKEYTKRNYSAALIQYNEAKKKLMNMAAKSNFKKSAPYQDALAYVLGEIIITTAEIALDNSEQTLNNKKINEIWAPIPGLCSEMDALYNQINHKKNLNTDKDRINTVYKALAHACIKISNDLINAIKNPEQATDKISHAIDWLSKTETYLHKITKDAINLMEHFDYLACLENGFDRTNDHQFIKKMGSYIHASSLPPLTTLSSEEQFKILYYQFLTAIKDENAHDLKNEYKTLIELSRELTKEHPFVLKFNLLSANMEHEEHFTVASDNNLANREIHHKHPWIIRDDSDEEMLTAIEDQQPNTHSKQGGKAKKVAKNDASAVKEHTDISDKITTGKSRKAKKVVKPQPKESTTTANSELVTAKTLSEFSQISADNDPGLSVLTKRFRAPEQEMPSKFKKNAPEVLANNHSSSQQPVQTNNVPSSQSPFTFFPSSLPLSISTSQRSLQKRHHEAFNEIIIEIANIYEDNDFLANLLSLIGNFYTHANRALPSSMSASCDEASKRLKTICKTENFKQDSATIFSQAIQKNITQIQERPNVDAHQIDELFDKLVTFIRNTSAGTMSPIIAELIATKYQLALLKQANILSEEINPLKNSLKMK